MRNHNIDFLRFVGLSMIILAHVHPPEVLFQLRNFDVPLMVLISGMSFGLAYKGESYSEYVWKRIKRLALPVWIFLSMYFVIFYPQNHINYHMIISSYLLIGGIGYVWIIRVFLMVALLAPFIYIFHNKTKHDSQYLITLLILFVLYEICRYKSMPFIQEGIEKYLSLVILYAIPYSILFALGLRIPTMSNKNIKIIFWFFLITFLAIALIITSITGNFSPTQQYKYPPSIYYFSYAACITILLWIFSENIWDVVCKIDLVKYVVLFMAQNSIWIYLWHISILKIVHTNFIFKYIIVVFSAICITGFQVWVVNNILTPLTSSVTAKKNIKMILTG